MNLTSPSFKAGEDVPSVHTCQGKDTSPGLNWAEVPEGVKSFVLIVDDPDAPDPKAPKTIWVHWVVYDIPADCRSLREAANAGGLPRGAREGVNDWKRPGWGGPCPPVGRHRYFFKLFALDTALPDLDAPKKADVEAAMQGHIVARAELMGTYQKR